MGIIEKIKELEDEVARTQKNKATEYHLGQLRAKIAKLRHELLEPPKKSGKPGEGFDVMKSGDARVALIGFPSVGKSSFLSQVTDTKSEAAAYEFTTLTCQPGVLEYEGTKIQILDLPGIIEGASEGKGRGRQVVSVAKTADMILMMLDATKPDKQRALLEYELEAVGIRLNKVKPDVVLKRKNAGGIVITKAMGLTLTKIDEKMIRSILQGYKMHNTDVMIREDITVDEFIDVVLGNRKYTPCLYVYNKIDSISMEQLDKLARQPNSVVISVTSDLNIDYLKDRMWELLGINRIYTKKRGERPDLSDPLVVRKGATIEHVCHQVHRALVDKFKYALVYGKSSKFPGSQKVGLNHVVAADDVVSIFTSESRRGAVMSMVRLPY
ncbi:probable GTP-binding protein [Pseudozyma flocculosa]|uniref:Probable GTP-binding protein n=1 Tax=Pseudozyma flocculosa TaxID=84751 RepID=A0A5C3F5G3_9BASI|nr:probable GTP-binding protein [Pseudozyma flocculosa]